MFRFKQFSCMHSRSSMKIGVDGVLIAAWTDCGHAARILDVGTGCGVIALICAQRNADSTIRAIDVHADSVAEAADNFTTSPWGDRLSADLTDFNAITDEKFDLIISNPPYFDSGISAPETSREVARHQSSLSPYVLIGHGRNLLSPEGVLSMIFPADQLQAILEFAQYEGMNARRVCLVKGSAGSAPKRAMVELTCADVPTPVEESLTIENAPNDFTDEYRELCRDLYLKF